MRTSPRSRVTRSAGIAVVLLLAAGCASRTGTDDAASSGSAPASSTAAQEGTTSSAPVTGSAGAGTSAPEPFPGDTRPDTADPVDPEGLTVTAVRAAAHEGYDRVVFELSGSGTPGWSVQYAAEPTAQGSGAALDVPGSAYLQVLLQGTSYPYETGATELPRGAVDVSGTETVQGVVYDATFEGTSAAWIGVAEQSPFRVYSLTGPSRVVVEVAHAG